MTELALANKHIEQGEFLAAEKIYYKLLKHDPLNGHAYWGMGNLALVAKRPDRAVSLLKKACQILTAEPMPLIQLAKAYNDSLAEQDALAVLEYGIKVTPNYPQMHYELGQQLLILGQLSQAEKSFRKVLNMGEGLLCYYALLEITRLKRFTSKDEDFQLILFHLTKPHLDDRQRIVLHYALGKIYDDLQNYEQAWEHFAKANAFQHKECRFNTKELDPIYKRIKQTNTPEVLKPRRISSATEITPIFIVGLPRTGSTLLEQILSRHSFVAGAGEIPYLSREVDDYIFAQTQQHYPDSLLALSIKQMDEAANIYLKHLSRHANGKRFVIDKLPANYQSIGLIYKLFPQAKVINLQRNAADVALSTYANYFSENEPYFCDLHEFKHFRSLYLDIMQHWHSVIPHFIFDLSYEQLVNDTENTLRDLLAFCNIDWEDACIDKELLIQPVKTLSNIQVRKPINRSSIGKWKHYQTHLQFLLD